MLENPYHQSNLPEPSLKARIDEAFIRIHDAIKDFNESATLEPADRLRIVQIGSIIVQEHEQLCLKYNESINDDMPF